MNKKNIDKSIQFQQKAKSIIPGLTQLLSKRPDMFSTNIWPGYFSKSKGCQVWDLDGNEYLDMSISGIGANILGYAVDEVDDAVKQAIETQTLNEIRGRLLEQNVSHYSFLVPSTLDPWKQVFLRHADIVTDSGLWQGIRPLGGSEGL